MLEGKELILATRPFAKEVRGKSWLYTLTTFGLLLLTIAGSFLPFHIGIRITCSILQALLLARMFVIYHDYMHKTILQKSFVANLIFTLLGNYMLTPKGIWKRSHDYHHKHNSKLYTSSVGSFPIVTTAKFNSMSKGERFGSLFVRHPLTIMGGYLFAFSWGMSLLSLLRSPKKHWDSAVALIFHFGLITFLVFNFGWLTAILTVIAPNAIALGFGSYLFYVQHNFPGVTYEEKEGWTYIGAAFNSTSLLRMSRVMQWFTANIGYHHVHHVNARIPFYRLVEAYDAFPEFQNPKSTTMGLRDVLACMRLKVWDPKLQKMLTMKELRAYSN